ncbi:MAG: N-acetylmuramoyl-L-alanine amidase, partial [Oscillospiraceae bacterium]|nr:N-acetylmuramoyl-L-alanine amidase [Oscillospiraceae bacterium]
ATILEGKSDIISRISSVTYKQDERGETLRLTGTAKIPYKAEMNDSELLVTVWNCADIPQQLGQVQSDLFDSVEPRFNDDGSVTFLFKRKNDSVLWGYNVEYDENDLLIYAKKAPVLSENASRPLDGVVIVIDAGHGGEDPGALGIAGSHGPAERELNFISAYASAQVLESMGATVHMVAPNNERLDFAGRMDPARQMRADFFISFHHNSTAETTDSRDYAGTEVYYHEDQSGLFAENLLNSITNATGRNARGAYQDYYRVTRMTYAPSVMLELGFVVNPTEYESLCRPISIYQTAMGVAQGDLQTIENAS